MKNKLKVSLKHVNDVRVKLGLDPHEAPIVKKEIKVKETFIEETEVEKDEFEETYKQMSPFKLILRRFFRSKLSVVGLCIIVFLFLFAFLGPVVYNKWGETEVDRTQVAKIYTEEKTIINEYGEEITIIQEIEIFDDNLKAYPSKDHLLGTDEKGMDIFVRLMYGGRISLTIGFIVVILETILGVLLGGISGYFGGKVDQVIMRIVDVFNCIPMLPILLIASAVLDAFSIAEIIDNSDRIYFLMLIITVFGWSGCARMVRGQILSLREQEFIVATEVMGIPTWRRIFVHLIPNVMPQLIVNMTLGLGSIILYESTLSYLGLGVQIPYAAWGTMISSSKNPEILSNYMNMWLPAGILIVFAVLGFNFVGDGLRDAMDPKSKK
jgi:peptide/nickel transport system permease protein